MASLWTLSVYAHHRQRLDGIDMNPYPTTMEASRRALCHEVEPSSDYHANGSHVRWFHPFAPGTVGAELERGNAERHAKFLAELDKLVAPRPLTVVEVGERAVEAVDSTGADLLGHRILSVLNLPGTNAAAAGRIAFCAEEEGYPPHYFTASAANRTIDGTQALPVEIITMIFALLRESIKGDVVGLAALSAVCSRWRGVCVGTVSLWGGTLYFPLPQFMGTVFTRSIARPLAITLDVLGISYHIPASLSPAPRASNVAECTRQWRKRMVRVPPPSMQSPFHVLTRVQERLESLILNLRPRDIIIDDADDPHFAQLTSLTLFIMDVEEMDVQEIAESDGDELVEEESDVEEASIILDRMMDFFQNSPALEAFALTAYAPYALRLRSPDFPWSQLTSLSIFIEMNGDDLYDILIQCIKLQECRLAHIQDYHSYQNQHQMPMLASLEFTTAEGAYVIILEVFKFPRLQSLAFTAHDDFCPVGEIIRCAPNGLLRLDLSACSIEPQAFNRLLQHLPYLEELTITDCSTAANFPFLESFTYESAPHPLRNLAKLKIGHISDAIDGRCLMRMIQSLWKHRDQTQAPFLSIRTIELDLNGRPFPDKVETYLAQMSALGFLCLSGVRNWQTDVGRETTHI
ncbi:hypothetical protein FB45DRAFT_863402 [Roridomyces roridus]|uniref:F-box domain-containing protein n=1 Tax=Roridomyces roridus TaxID=1738132 RepID=A0AAD7C3M3_9AGAR|nr:hypothetical protein FB45DRAFT_863402 [Roridomyces roridus]